MLCSDGLSNLVPPDEVGAVVAAFPAAEACKFLIDLANLRGGPDNITVVIVRIGKVQDSIAASLVKGPGLLVRAGKAWAGEVPWPISVLILGFGLAGAFALFAASGWPGASAFFVLALLAIGTGLVGLWKHARRDATLQELEPNGPRRLNVYRQYPSRVDAGLLDRWRKLTLHLKEQFESRPDAVNREAFRRSQEAAAKAEREGDMVTAFREETKSLGLLAAAVHKLRHKEEGFKPKWDTTADA